LKAFSYRFPFFSSWYWYVYCNICNLFYRILRVKSVDTPGNLPSPPNVVDDTFNETDEFENIEENIFESTAETLNMSKASNE
jgi:hypothetical protein